jgi:glycosyltransferase involved in cell wall biosynthesis
MRIGFDAKRAFTNGTGLGNYSRFVINGLLKHFPEHEYFLFTPRINDEFEDFYPKGDHVKVVTPGSFLGKTFSALWRTYAIDDMCNELKLDVFHGLSNELPAGIEAFHGKKIVTIHDLIFIRYPDYYRNIDRYIYTKKFRNACAHADTVIAASDQTKRDIISFFGTDSRKIVTGYQDCYAGFGKQADRQTRQLVREKFRLNGPYILCVGTIEQRKNQLTVLKAFCALERPDISLVFIGRETPYADELYDYIDQHAPKAHVSFLHNISRDELPVIYQEAAVFVYASEFEGFGIPVLEGLRSGIPVIAADASSLPEVGGDAVAYVNPHSVEDLKQKLADTLSGNHPATAAKVKEQLAKFDTELLITQLMQVYRQ